MKTTVALLLASALACVAFLGAPSATSAMPLLNKFFAEGPQATLEAAIRADDVPGIGRALALGAKVNSPGKFDATPLMIAVDAQSLRAVTALLQAGALPNAQAADGHSPVSLAVQNYRARPNGRDIMLAIFKAGGNPDARQPDGEPVLMRFLLDHDPAGLALMKSLGAHLDVLDRAGDPLIATFAWSQDWDMVWAMIELGASVDYPNVNPARSIGRALKLNYPSPDSPLFPYKLKVWQHLKDRGIAVPPLRR